MASLLKVLLVDDEADITTIIKNGLEKHGWHADVFNDPKLALSNFKPNYYDFVILDVRMPGMNGFQLAKRMWAIDERVKICFLSAFEIYANEATKVFTDFKDHSFVKKPITPKELIQHIEAQITQAR